MTQGSPAWRANPGLNEGIPLGFKAANSVWKKITATLSDGARVCDSQQLRE